jgi:hypothetical protein
MTLAVSPETVIVADPVTVGAEAEAVSVFAPAEHNVAVNVVVLTPFVTLTALTG